MKTNEELQKDVQDSIKWEPLLKAAEIGVTAIDGVITLSGIVDSYTKKLEAESAAKNVSGVKAVVEKIEIKFGSLGANDDNAIAKEVLNAFKWNAEVPKDIIKIKVENGWITLEGELPWNYQREAAKKSISNILGVKGVINNIKINSETKDDIEKKDIELALRRNWSIDEREVLVNVSGNRVILNGSVHSWYQKDQASRIAWNAPGVLMVDNELVIN